MEKSSMNNSTDSWIMSCQIANMHLWKVAGGLQRPKEFACKQGWTDTRNEEKKVFPRMRILGDQEEVLSSRSVGDSVFSSIFMAMNLSNSEKILSSRGVPSME
ncbi:hypothetical protein Tco_0255833 [Tanacetum coccineum]